MRSQHRRILVGHHNVWEGEKECARGELERVFVKGYERGDGEEDLFDMM